MSRDTNTITGLLDHIEPMTIDELAFESGIPEGRVRVAVKYLQEVGQIKRFESSYPASWVLA
ncbi:hypothetical protein KC887_04730 [Candidatus Kaiserbacteria bacterium]|nr:hypothetical protein [Candidatus Kaiserbacteria bacterium]